MFNCQKTLSTQDLENHLEIKDHTALPFKFIKIKNMS